MNSNAEKLLIERIERIDASDSESAHAELDGLLLSYYSRDVREAAQQLMIRADWWCYA